jgi:hypothetical protein
MTILSNLPSLPENLSGKFSENYLHFGFLAIRQEKTKTFTLKNTSLENIRFHWDTADLPVDFEPSIGHLLPNSTKDILLTMKSGKSFDFENQTVSAEIIPINYFSENVNKLWDDRIKSIKWVNDPETKKLKKVFETESEPEYETNTKIKSEKIELIIQGVIDFAKAEISQSDVNFGPSELFSQKTETIILKNSGKVDLEFNWDLFNQQTGESRPATGMRSFLNTALPSAFEEPVILVTPDSGRLQPDEQIEVTIRFNPNTGRLLNIDTVFF